ncbi:MAG: transporter substrate-binding domain-containing protein, partial [Paucibacter sp.]|nr:transporter substrate-binding domain-containing protein [Roseateles sp.]
VTADPEFPPYAWYDGKQLRGASVDVVTSVLDSMHLPYELRYVGPFVRVLRSARFGEVDIVTELKRNPEREQFLVFSESPIFSNPSSVFVRSDVSRTVNSREALVGLRGGVTHGTKFGDGMDEYIDAHLSVEVAPGIKENFAKLAAGRIDYFLSPHYPALSYLIASGRADQFQALKPFVAQAMNYVGWSRKSACLARLDEFNAGLRRYLASINSMRLVEASYDLWQHSPQMVR